MRVRTLPAGLLGGLAVAACLTSGVSAQMTPVTLSGFNMDIVVENTAFVPYSFHGQTLSLQCLRSMLTN